MSWIFLVGAGLFEMVWGVSLKYTHGWTKLLPSLITVAGMVLSFWLLAHALKTLPLGLAYAIWTGIGTIGITIASVVLFGDHLGLPQFLCIGLIVAGIAGLKLLSA